MKPFFLRTKRPRTSASHAWERDEVTARPPLPRAVRLSPNGVHGQPGLTKITKIRQETTDDD